MTSWGLGTPPKFISVSFSKYKEIFDKTILKLQLKLSNEIISNNLKKIKIYKFTALAKASK